MLPSRSEILIEAIQCTEEQENKEGNTLGTDPSNNQGNFSKQFCFYFLDPSWMELIVDSMKI